MIRSYFFNKYLVAFVSRRQLRASVYRWLSGGKLIDPDATLPTVQS
jgi:hypothetical protein